MRGQETTMTDTSVRIAGSIDVNSLHRTASRASAAQMHNAATAMSMIL
jgi:hypothetical protein